MRSYLRYEDAGGKSRIPDLHGRHCGLPLSRPRHGNFTFLSRAERGACPSLLFRRTRQQAYARLTLFHERMQSCKKTRKNAHLLRVTTFRHGPRKDTLRFVEAAAVSCTYLAGMACAAGGLWSGRLVRGASGAFVPCSNRDPSWGSTCRRRIGAGLCSRGGDKRSSGAATMRSSTLPVAPSTQAPPWLSTGPMPNAGQPSC